MNDDDDVFMEDALYPWLADGSMEDPCEEPGAPDDGVACSRCGRSISDSEYEDNGKLCESCAEEA